jgi:predicted transposase YbfD/YdcC
VLAQRHVEEHSNEQTALPVLLKQLELAGCIVSIDAMGCLPKIARHIKEQDGEYVLALKANQGSMYQDVIDLFDDALTTGFAELVHDTHHSVDKVHGRGCAALAWSNQSAQSASKSLENGAITEAACRAMLKPLGARCAADFRVENGLHWVLDIAFQEDASRMRHPIRASRTLWCCATWRSICSNRNRQPSAASKLGD